MRKEIEKEEEAFRILDLAAKEKAKKLIREIKEKNRFNVYSFIVKFVIHPA